MPNAAIAGLRDNAYMESIIRSMLSSLIVTDAQGEILMANQATLDLLDYDEGELIGQPLSVINVDDAINLSDMEVLASRDHLVREEIHYRNKAGQGVPVLFASSPLFDEADQLKGIVCVALDLSNHKILKAQLLQSAKLASIGQLAAGVAHEINNPMGFIFSNLGTLGEYVKDITELLAAYKRLEEAVASNEFEQAQTQLTELKKKKEALDLDYLLDDIGELIEESREGADRVRKIVLNLKEFTHVGHEKKKPANLNDGLDSTINIVWNELKYKVTLKKEYGEIAEVPCYLQEINQVFMNLLVNAGHAIEEQGEIKIRTYEEDDSVCVDIADTGKGMPPEVQQRIFEPFYTTKEVGVGTGLGLSMGYQIIVVKHGGELLVDSEEGMGTTFTIKLPKVASGT